MAKWDASKNKVLAEKKIKEDNRTIFVQVTKYELDQEKISIYQIQKDKNGKEWTDKLKPMNLETALKVGIAIKKLAKEYMEDLDLD